MTMSGLSCAIKGCFGNFLEKHLPNRTKRMMFIASLSARLKGTETFDNITLLKLNQVMALSNTESALKLPVQLSRAIWRGRSSYEIFNADVQKESTQPSRIKDMAVQAAGSMPAWLRYDKNEGIEDDVVLLLNNSKVVLGV